MEGTWEIQNDQVWVHLVTSIGEIRVTFSALGTEFAKVFPVPEEGHWTWRNHPYTGVMHLKRGDFLARRDYLWTVKRGDGKFRGHSVTAAAYKALTDVASAAIRGYLREHPEVEEAAERATAGRELRDLAKDIEQAERALALMRTEYEARKAALQ